jgi:SNF2 family DNA or RNA helicase
LTQGQAIVQHAQERFKTRPYQHQIEDIALLFDHEFFFLANEMGTGKSATVINAACLLREHQLIYSVLVISPAAVRSVWINPDFGEVKKHCWFASCVLEFHQKLKIIWRDKHAGEEAANRQLFWLVTNYEFIRSEEHRDQLKQLLHGRKFMMVCDESSFIKSAGAAQTKACIELGQLAVRRVALNGTPIGNNPMDLWSQVAFLSRRILPYKNFYAFRADFAEMKTRPFPKIIRFKNLDRLQDLIAPHCVRREKKDCLDLPEKIYTVQECALSEETWKIYKTMRDDAVVWMDEHPSMAAQAGVKVMRLSQITGGFLGGFEREDFPVEVIDGHALSGDVQEIGREKLDMLRSWVTELLAERPNRKIIVWCRFRKEIERVATDLADLITTYRLYGQSKTEREEAVGIFSDLRHGKPALLSAQEQAGGFGLNLIAADAVAYYSQNYSLMNRLQSEDRCHRPGQKNNVLYLDILATGPKGQKTVDHVIYKALKAKEELATWTVSAWKRALMEEEE